MRAASLVCIVQGIVADYGAIFERLVGHGNGLLQLANVCCSRNALPSLHSTKWQQNATFSGGHFEGVHAYARRCRPLWYFSERRELRLPGAAGAAPLQSGRPDIREF
uniref:Uncharacterized protein n=1 Tax=Ixodes ricinus TaxID=34613 RepID=A0A6B0UHR9_IXORI